MNNDERRLWVLNDEGLYNWRKQSRQPMRKFLADNRAEIDAGINRALNRTPCNGCPDCGERR